MVKIIYEKGIPFIDIDGKRFDPAAFRSFRPRPDNVSLAARTGIELMQILVSDLPCTLNVPYSMYGGVWKGDGVYDFSAFDRQFEMFRRYAPNAYFNVMLQLDVCPWFAEKYPNEDTDSYHHLAELAMNEEWKRSAADYLKAFIAYAEEKYSDRIWGYSIAAGLCNEWFDHSLYDTSFDRENTRLTALWRKEIGKPVAPAPTLQSMDAANTLRAPSSDDFCYLKLANEQVGNLVCFFAHEAQKVLKHQKLFGLFFGYICMQDNHQVYWNTNDYEKVWRSPDIDMLYSPAAYSYHRALDNVSSYQYAVDSIRANGKLYLHENDHRTDLARFPLENGAMLHDCYETFEEWREVFRRELCNVMQKQSAFWWFDFFGGYYSSPEYENELKKECEIYHALGQGERRSNAEIAVFIDPTSMLCAQEHTKLCFDIGKYCIDELHRCGAPFDFYNQNDLLQLDMSQYKLCVFLNAYLLPDELLSCINEKLQGKTKVFLHAPGLWDGKAFNKKRMEDILGMQIAPREKESSRTSYLGVSYEFSAPVQPLFQVEDADAKPLALYEDGAVSCACKGDVVYSAVGRLTWQFWRDLAKMAGAHIYDENGGGSAICSQFIASYTTLRENCELHPKEDGVYREIFSGKTYECKNGALRYSAPKGTTMLFVKEKLACETDEE
ncbi:MAG: hypothetical protein E7329_04465 [Clostridiales bacterium]|nr:hypothetical protein [Clostridiales bacterium]